MTAEMVDHEVRSEGVCELRGLGERMEIFSMVVEGLESEFARLRTAAALGNLPVLAADVIGRQGLVDELVVELAESRLFRPWSPPAKAASPIPYGRDG